MLNGFWAIDIANKTAKLKNKKLIQKVVFEVVFDNDLISKVNVTDTLYKDFSYIEDVSLDYTSKLEHELKMLGLVQDFNKMESYLCNGKILYKVDNNKFISNDGVIFKIKNNKVKETKYKTIMNKINEKTPVDLIKLSIVEDTLNQRVKFSQI